MGLINTGHRLASWPLLKLYYSAFFAAHAVMRSQGTGVVKIERNHVNKINQFLSLIGVGGGSLTPGMYIYSLDLSVRNSPRMTFSPHGAGGGVHEAFWKSFCQFLDDRANAAVASGAVDAQNLVSGSEEVKLAISGSAAGSGSWISAMRNDINYQHKHAVWFPIRRSDSLGNLITDLRVKASKNAALGSSASSKPVHAFVEISHYLACLNVDISEFVAARSTKGGAFGQKWRRMRQQLV